MLSSGPLSNMLSGSSFSVGHAGAVLYNQSGGAAIWAAAFNMGYTGGTGVADISGGTLTHTGTSTFMNASGFGGAGTGILTVRGSGYLQEQGGSFLVTGANNAGVTGILNLLNGGTIEANKIAKAAGSNSTATINFDGGTLKAYSTNAGASFLTGLDHAFVYPGGLTVVNNNSSSITIGQALTAPTGYGVGLSGGSIAVSSGGSGYIAPPVVTFAAPASGVAATGVANLTNGVVTSITITSPGSGYTSGQSVAVTFNTGGSSANAYVSVATPPSVTASNLNGSGGLTFAGTGITILSGNNNYGGPTVINSGTLQLGNSAALGSGALDANGGTLDLAGFGITVPSFSGAAGVVTDSSSTAGATTLMVNQSANTSFNGSFQTGPNGRQISLQQQGAGSLTLGGADTLLGATVQNTATLQITGSVTTGAVNVNAGAMLAGNGSVNLLSGGSLNYNSSAASTFGLASHRRRGLASRSTNGLLKLGVRSNTYTGRGDDRFRRHAANGRGQRPALWRECGQRHRQRRPRPGRADDQRQRPLRRGNREQQQRQRHARRRQQQRHEHLLGLLAELGRHGGTSARLDPRPARARSRSRERTSLPDRRPCKAACCRWAAAAWPARPSSPAARST